ncbi:DUF4157 domain-containing protein [Grimontia hollisae]|uniref:eCIS core domain-containing protein n=1 Tax=Grimontia hollisae CIP 101886 TaxID=675812 RepID=D0I6J8_GRIHO|nr:DUF4157 domain-containing protein [Grimontia hollisae]AMG31544.1 DUF4157 domain-containing protein [Grimontia hollisae]EEY72267.1 hypothetical protein VHA_001365 [Grimontia hollisae CIP 101886]MDF2185912.1 DUF4157 domain-containing protein [Grimontia hollisae]STO45384.1 Uncharacterised protein [Grimontia hollisae]
MYAAQKTTAKTQYQNKVQVSGANRVDSHSPVQRFSPQTQLSSFSLSTQFTRQKTGEAEAKTAGDLFHHHVTENPDQETPSTPKSDQHRLPTPNYLSGQGAPLPSSLQSAMCQYFHQPFSQVTIHNSPAAHTASQTLNARAFTIGNHIAFGRGEYSPHTRAGQSLIAHELAHVVQQRQGRASIMRQALPASLRSRQNVETMTTAELNTQIELLLEWLNSQETYSEEHDHLREYLEMMEYERQSRELSTEPPTPPQPPPAQPPRLPASSASTPAPTPQIATMTLVSSGGSGSGPTRTPLTPQEMFRIITDQRAWHFSPGRGQVIEDPAGVGRGVGPATTGRPAHVPRTSRPAGSTVFASMQLIDAQGNQVALSYGEHTQYRAPHAEQGATSALRRAIPHGADIQGGRLVVVLDQVPCGPGSANCMQTLRTAARELGVGLEVLLPERQAQRGTRTVRPRTAAMGSQRTDMPRVRLVRYAPLYRAPPARRAPAGDGTTAAIGTPNMSGLNVGGPSARGEAIGAGITIAFMGANFILNEINDYIQQQRVEEALAGIRTSLETYRSEHRQMGTLLVFRYTQQEAPPDSLIQPGAVFRSVMYYHGATQDEARRTWRNTPEIHASPQGSRQSTQTVWIPPIQRAATRALRTPFPREELATFATGRAELQHVEWGGITGFDDESTHSLTLGNTSPRFYILRIPDELVFMNGSERVSVDIPITFRSAHQGGAIRVVNLDPAFPGYNVSAALVFPADNATERLFSQTPATRDNLRQLRSYTNIRKARWVRPENIQLLD